jgi:hypothetical protein
LWFETAEIGYARHPGDLSGRLISRRSPFCRITMRKKRVYGISWTPAGQNRAETRRIQDFEPTSGSPERQLKWLAVSSAGQTASLPANQTPQNVADEHDRQTRSGTNVAAESDDTRVAAGVRESG